MNRASGFLQTRHDTESQGNKACSPRGRVKSTVRPACRFMNALAAASSLWCKLSGNRMTEALGGIRRQAAESPAFQPLP